MIPVLIAGGGPVGMTLALALARLGTRCLLVERNPGTTLHPKMDITNARSMEIFAALGVAADLRAVAVPEGHCFDVSWVTSMAGRELHRFRYPSVTEWRARIAADDTCVLPGEPPMRVSQVEIEPVLARHVRAHPLIEARWGVGLEDCAQDAEGVTATLSTGETVRAAYLAGCDGGGSRVRAALGIGLDGEFAVMRRFMTHFRSDDRGLLQRFGVAWHYQSNRGTLIAQNDRDIWTLHTRWSEGEAPDETDPRVLLRGFLGTEVEAEILVANAWTPHLLVTRAYGRGRIWLAGDAAHQYIPTGGYGMNTGIGDAFGLAWKLAAAASGLGGAGLLPAYEAERLPVGRRNREASGRHADIRRQIGALYERPDPAPGIAALGNAENESWGIELGYHYAGSPIVAVDDERPSDDPLIYTPSTAPGARLPSPGAAPLLPGLGPWFTLLHPGVPDAGLLDAAARRGLPLATLPWAGETMLLVRPDQHIAWRGRTARHPDAILARALGHAV